MRKLVIATRKSPLALRQTEWLRQKLLALHPELKISLLPMTTTGDQQIEQALYESGGKGLFLKELEKSLLSGEADCAVHSMKDVPAALPEGLMIAAIGQREDPRDVFVSEKFTRFDELPQHAVIGTASLRRQAQVLAVRPDLKIKLLRGNVQTRLAKLKQGEYDAIVLAAAGLKRLALQQHIRHFFSPEQILPAVGQGAIGIECRSEDTALRALLSQVSHRQTTVCVQAERAINTHLGSGCHLPIAGYAECHDQKLWLRTLVASTDGEQVIHAQAHGSVESPLNLGFQVAEQLIAEGADKILEDSSLRS